MEGMVLGGRGPIEHTAEINIDTDIYTKYNEYA